VVSVKLYREGDWTERNR